MSEPGDGRFEAMVEAMRPTCWWTRKEAGMSRGDRITNLEKRVAALESRRREEEHVHRYRYSKSRTSDHGPGYYFWSWTCRDEEGDISKDCPQPSGGTNTLVGLPDHFPSDLR